MKYKGFMKTGGRFLLSYYWIWCIIFMAFNVYGV